MNNFKKQLARFFITGCSAVGTDYLFYFLLMNYLNPTISKTISFLIGTLVAFLLNKFWTFGKKQISIKEILQFSLLYLTSLLANVTVNKIVLAIAPDWLSIAFVFATGTSTVLNFVGQKWWVFRDEKVKHSSSMLQRGEEHSVNS